MKRKRYSNRAFLILLFCFIFNKQYAQNSIFDELKTIAEVKTTTVKDQARTGTCWSFGTTSFLESELLRMGKGEIGISEMFTIRCTYEDHAKQYVRYHGKLNFTSGAQGWDLFNVVDDYGIVPREAYPGLRVDPNQHDHREMDKVLKAAMDALIQMDKLSPVWEEAISGILDAYLGDYPSEFEYKGKKYTPASFRDFLSIDASDYWAFTSFSHHPYYTQYVFESPDNWSNGVVKNVKLDDIPEIISHALKNGYSVVWASDVSDPGFAHNKGLAIVPEKNWEEMTKDERMDQFKTFVKQKKITPEMHQEGYENYETTDDHLMHIIGMAKHKDGTVYYKVKNSWGTENPLGGYFYVSEAYVKLRTMTIAVHKEAVPEKIAEKF